MKISKFKALCLTVAMTLSMALSACSSNTTTSSEAPKESATAGETLDTAAGGVSDAASGEASDTSAPEEAPETAATLGEIADYLVRVADDYNDQCTKERLLEGLGSESDQATRVQALVMVSRAFGKLPVPQGNDARLAPENVDLSAAPDWAVAELKNLVDGGVLAPSDLGLEELGSGDDMDLMQADNGASGESEISGGEAQGNDGDFGLAVPEDAQDQTGHAPMDAPEDEDSSNNVNSSVLESAASLKEVETYCKRVYALFGNNLKDDFYQNVNKNELDNTELPEGEATAGGSKTVELETNKKVQQLIKDIVDSDEAYARGSNEQKIRDFYRSVLAKRTEGLAPLQAWFEKIDQAAELAALRDVQIELIQKMGLSGNGLLPFSLSTDLSDSSKTVLNLTSGFMVMTLEDYENKDSKAHQEYRASIIENLIKCGEDRETAEELADAIIAQEAEEMKHGMTSEEAADLNNYNNTFTMSELSELFPELGVTEFFTALGFKDTMTIQCYDPKTLEITAQHMNASELPRLKALVKLNLLGNNEGFLTGQATEQEALDEVSVYLTNEVGQLYVEKYFPAEAKADVEKMVAQLIETYKKRITALDWMSEESKKEAINKLDTLKVYIGYPDQWPQSELEISAPKAGGSYFENMAAIGREGLRQNVADQNGTKDSFGLTVYMVNAAANRQSNSLVFPAGILQAPFYDPEASFEENLGGIGVIIAHEISHSFDDQGAQYDATGAVRDWWSADDYSHFKQLCQKVVGFYDGEEPATGIATDGQATLSENIADIGGMACALELLGTMENPDYDKFFRSYAKSWLLLSDRAYMAGMAASDEHAPKKVRVNKVVQNFDEFYKTYNIGEGDGMYVAPENRIKIW